MMRRLKQRQRQQRNIWAMLNKPATDDFKSFKEGDFVILITDLSDILDMRALYQVVSVGLDVAIALFGSNKVVARSGIFVAHQEFRHATIQEVIAGYRIDKIRSIYAHDKYPYNLLTGEQVGAVLNFAQVIDVIERTGETQA